MSAWIPVLILYGFFGLFAYVCIAVQSPEMNEELNWWEKIAVFILVMFLWPLRLMD